MQTEVFGQHLHYREEGSGPAVVLLHALGGDLSDWDKNIGPLAAAGFRVIAFDTIGSGKSDKPSIAYRTSTLVDFLGGFLDALGIESAVLVGHSYNGGVAGAFAIAYPHRVLKLVLLSSGYALALPPAKDPSQLGHAPGTFSLIFPRNLAETAALVKLAVADGSAASDPATVAGAFSQVIQASFLMSQIRLQFLAREEALDDRLASIRVPTLVMWGKKDGVTPFPLSQVFVNGIPGARLVAFENSAHFPNQEDAEPFNTALLSFLQETAAERKLTS